MEADMKAEKRAEPVSLMEPLLLGSRDREPLTDLALELTQKSASFRMRSGPSTAIAHCRQRWLKIPPAVTETCC